MNRTLVIGVGSTGLHVCDDLIRRIEWARGGLSMTPWIRILALETEQHPSSLCARQGCLLNLGLENRALLPLITQPQNYEALLDLERWLDRNVVDAKASAVNGAGAIRMVGRLCFFAPDVFARIRRRLIDELQHLQSVTLNDVLQALPDQGSAVSLDSALHVYVTGSLVGGTCSGIFVDLGYVLEHLKEGLGVDLERCGVFALPPLGLDDTVAKANGYAALLEANHFLTPGSVYAARLPVEEKPDVLSGGVPYERCFVVQPKVKPDLPDLERAIGDYIFGDAVSLDNTQLQGMRADALPFARGLDKYGASLRWMTFGVRSLEYPVAWLMEGCSYHLVVDAMEQALRGGQEPERNWLPELKLDEGSLARRLGALGETGSVKERLREAAITESSSISPPQVAAVEAALARPGTSQPAAGGLEGWAREALDANLHRVQMDLGGSLIASPGFGGLQDGLRTLLQRVQSARAQIAGEIRRLEERSPEGWTDSETRARMERDALDQALKALETGRRRPWFAFWRRQPSDEPARRQLQRYAEALVDQHLAERRARLLHAADEHLARWETRLQGARGSGTGLIGYVEALREKAARRRDEIAKDLGSHPSPFVQAPVVDQEFAEVLGAAAAERGSAPEAVLREWRQDLYSLLALLPDQLAAPPGGSFVDHQDPDQLQTSAGQMLGDLVQRAKRRFEVIRNTTIVSRLTDVRAAFQWLLEGGSHFLEMDEHGPAMPRPGAKQTYSLFLWDERSAGAESNQANFRVLKELVDERQRGSEVFRVSRSTDPHRLVLVREFVGFSLNAVKGMTGEVAPFRDAYLSRNDSPHTRPQSRKDVRWTPLGKEELDRLREARHLFLVAVAAGIIEQQAANRLRLEYEDYALQEEMFTANVDEAAGRLYDRRDLFNQLRMKVRDWRDGRSPQEVVAAMRDYAHQVLPTSGLLLKGGALTTRAFLLEVGDYWDRFADTRDAWYARKDINDPARHFYKEAGADLGDGVVAGRAGFHCPKCRLFLGMERGDLRTPCQCGDQLLAE